MCSALRRILEREAGIEAFVRSFVAASICECLGCETSLADQVDTNTSVNRALLFADTDDRRFPLHFASHPAMARQ